MARLKAARMTNATLVSTVDDNVGDVESAVAAIMGLLLDQEYSGSVFQRVATDGTVSGLLKFAGPADNIETTIGIEFSDSTNTKKYRIVCLLGELTLYEYDTDDYPSSWEPISVLSVPIKTLQQLEEFAVVDLTEKDGQVLRVNVDEDDNVTIDTISASEAGAVAFPDLSDVSDTIYTSASDGDLIKISKPGVGDPYLTYVSPDVAASDVQVLGDLEDVEPAAIVDSFRGYMAAVSRTKTGDPAQYKMEYVKHIVANGQYNQDNDSIPINQLARPYPVGSSQLTAQAPWTPIPYNIIVAMGDGIDGLGLESANMFTPGSAAINLPEAGGYIIHTSVTWQYRYSMPRDVQQDETQQARLAPHARRHRIEAVNGTSAGQCANEGYALPHLYYNSNLEPDGQILSGIYAVPPINKKIVVQATGFWYALQDNATIRLAVHQGSGVTQEVYYATVFIAKIR